MLQTARESASQIKVRAEENAARVMREAHDEANRVRQEAEVEAARHRQEAQSDAEAEVAHAKQQGREMVSEARAYRERVLADLERRTKLARQHIEELANGRDRLLQVFERARLVAVDITSELQRAIGPDEFVSFAPTTGPVPLMVPASRLDDDAGDRDRSDDDGRGRPAADVRRARPTTPSAGRGDADRRRPATDTTSRRHRRRHGRPRTIETQPSRRDRGRRSSRRTGESSRPHDADRDPEATRGQEARHQRRRPVPEPPGRRRGPARRRRHLRPAAQRGARSPSRSPTPPTSRVESTAFTRRDEALVPLIVTAARKLKRVLADEQNGVLDTLRRKEPVTSIDALVPALDAHVAMYVDAIADELGAAAAAGAAEFGAKDTKTLAPHARQGGRPRHHAGVRAQRPRRHRCAPGSSGRWSTAPATTRRRPSASAPSTANGRRSTSTTSSTTCSGTRSVAGWRSRPSRASRWRGRSIPSEAACADCEDNSLAGAIPAGEPFPTGHTSAPAHPGCRCLTLPAHQ